MMAESVMLPGSSFSTNSTTSSKINKREGEVTPQKTVLRLKRRIEDSPSQVLVLSFKRSKQDIDSESVEPSNSGHSGTGTDLYSQVFRLAGTVTTEKTESSVAETIKTALLDADNIKNKISDSREAIKNRVIRRLKGPSHKAKEELRKQYIESRFKVICSKRGHPSSIEVKEDENSPPLESDCEDSNSKQILSNETERLYNLLDLVAENEVPRTKKAKLGSDPRTPGSVTCNGVPMLRQKAALEVIPTQCALTDNVSKNSELSAEDSDYVFDLYVSNEAVVDEQMHNQFVSVRHADEGYELNSYREVDSSDNEGGLFDDEDSNDEGNWRNEYPDTDPDSSEDTGGVRDYDDESERLPFNFGGIKLNSNGDELSSDDEALGGIYSMEDDGLDNSLGGSHSHYSQYRRYKARIRQEEELADEVVSSPSDSDYD